MYCLTFLLSDFIVRLECNSLKVILLNSAVYRHLDRSNRCHFTPGRPAHSDANSFGKHSATMYTARRLFSHISTAVYDSQVLYSFLHLSSTAELLRSTVTGHNTCCPMVLVTFDIVNELFLQSKCSVLCLVDYDTFRVRKLLCIRYTHVLYSNPVFFSALYCKDPLSGFFRLSYSVVLGRQ